MRKFSQIIAPLRIKIPPVRYVSFTEGDGTASGYWTPECVAMSLYVAPYDMEITAVGISSASGDPSQEYRIVIYDLLPGSTPPAPRNLLAVSADLLGMPTGYVVLPLQTPLKVSKGQAFFAGGHGDVGHFDVSYNEGFGLNCYWYNNPFSAGPQTPAPYINNILNSSTESAYKSHKWGLDVQARNLTTDAVFGNQSLQRAQTTVAPSGQVNLQQLTLAYPTALNGFFFQVDNAAVNAHWDMLIYSDSNGPSSLVYTSNTSVGLQSGWNYTPISANVAAGTYWLGVSSDTPNTSSYGRTDQGTMALANAAYGQAPSTITNAVITSSISAPMFVTGVPTASNGAHAYWRMLFENIPGGGLGIGEMQMYDAANNALCSGGTPIGVGTYGPAGFGPAQAFDGSLDSFWCGTGAPGALGYQFVTAVAVASVKVTNRNLGDGYNASFPSDWQIQYSDDAESWTTTNSGVFSGVGSQQAVTVPAYAAVTSNTTTSNTTITPHQYWGIRINSGYSTPFALAELGFALSTTSGLYATTNGVAYADTYYSAAYPPSNAFDNNVDTLWASADTTVGTKLYYKFANAVAVGMVQLTARNDSNFQQAPENFDVISSDDGQTWTTQWQDVFPTPSQGRVFQSIANATVDQPGGHNYWRVVSLTAPPGGNTSLSEIVFSQASGVAENTAGTPFSSSSYGGDVASMAFDGTSSTYWASNGTGAGEYCGLQFIYKAAVKSVTLTARNDTYYGQAPTDFAVQYSDDGQTWTNAWTVHGVSWSSAGQSQTFSAVHKYWRLEFQNLPSGGWGIGEMQMFDASNTALCTGGTPIAQGTYGSAGFGPAQAFDGSLDSFWCGTSAPGALGYEFENAVQVKSMTVTNRNLSDGYGASFPTDWQVQFSDDGVNWTNGVNGNFGSVASQQSVTITV